MCATLREMMDEELLRAKSESFREGFREGFRESKLEVQLESLTNVMESFSIDIEKAMDILLIPAAEREICRSQLR